MKALIAILAFASSLLSPVSAATWYFLRWNTPSTSVQFQSFSMTMVAPALQKKGTYYLWPGLQDVANTGVYQHVLDGRSGTWWIGAGWCCSNPNLPWGSGFNVATGDQIQISMTKDADGKNWDSVTSMGSNSAKDSFALGGKNFNQALLAIELTGVTWDFGQLVWKDVTMVMNTTSTSWCTNKPENYNSATKYTMTTPKATTSGGKTTCTIDQVVMQGPASSKRIRDAMNVDVGLSIS